MAHGTSARHSCVLRWTSCSARRLAESHGERGARTVRWANDVEPHGVARLEAAQHSTHVTAHRDGCVVDAGDDVLWLDAASCRGRAALHARDEHTLAHGKTELRGEVLVDVAEGDAEIGADVLSRGEHLAGHVHREVDRDGEAESRHALAEQLGAVDADDVAPRVDERTTGVAGTDGGIGL